MTARKVTRDDFGDAWPLTIEECWLRRCPKTGALRVQVKRGRLRYKVYALNGIASQVYGDDSIEPVHAIEVYSPYAGEPGVRKSLGPLIKAAEQLGGKGMSGSYVRVNSERGYVLSRLVLWTAALLEHHGARRLAWRLACTAPGVTPSRTDMPGWHTTRTVRDPDGHAVHIQRRQGAA